MSFEWFVEGNERRLGSLPAPPVADADHARDLIHGMAGDTRAFATDETNHAIGRAMKRLDRWNRVSAAEARAQAEALIPMAAGLTVAMVRRALRDVGEPVSASPSRETTSPPAAAVTVPA